MLNCLSYHRLHTDKNDSIATSLHALQCNAAHRDVAATATAMATVNVNGDSAGDNDANGNGNSSGNGTSDDIPQKGLLQLCTKTKPGPEANPGA
jgi:hypothetical protein|mmetsp:Transcript_98182/g.165372  ORF Transcript_98182/g.165372 Transcript_98182/m.165372 type:complete len:94 (-) Transcript_98182:78-359(-)